MDGKVNFLIELAHKLKDPEDISIILDNIDLGSWGMIKFFAALHFWPILITALIVAVLTFLLFRGISKEISFSSGKQIIAEAEKQVEKIRAETISESKKYLSDIDAALRTAIYLQNQIQKPICENKSLKETVEGKDGFLKRIIAQENFSESYTKKMAVKGLELKNQ